MDGDGLRLGVADDLAAVSRRVGPIMSEPPASSPCHHRRRGASTEYRTTNWLRSAFMGHVRERRDADRSLGPTRMDRIAVGSPSTDGGAVAVQRPVRGRGDGCGGRSARRYEAPSPRTVTGRFIARWARDDRLRSTQKDALTWENA